MVTINQNWVTAKFFVATDVYFYTTDNRPLAELLKNEAAIADTLNEVLDSNEEIATFIIESPSVETSVGGFFRSKIGGTIDRITVSAGLAGASGSFLVDVNINGVTCFTNQANRPSLAFDDANSEATVTGAPIEVDNVPALGLISVDIDAIQTGTPRWLRIDVFIKKTITVREADDYQAQGDPLTITYVP